MKDAQTIWQDIISKLEVDTNSLVLDVWIRPIEAVGIFDETLVVRAPNEEVRNQAIKTCMPLIKSALHSIEFAPTEIAIIIPGQEDKYTASEEKVEVKTSTKEVCSPINPKYNFDTFVVGDCNRLSYSAAQAVAEDLGGVYNPLFIYGGVGLGKTHLMLAIGNQVKVAHPSAKIMYVSSETFVNDFIESIRTSKGSGNSSFRDRYRSVDLLMIDDVQFISRKPGTQEEIFHTFNDLYQAGKQLVFTSDRPPKEIRDLEERVRSRFEWGLITDVQPPDLETRIAILQKKAQMAKVNVPTEALAYLAERIDSNIREMESVLTKLIFLSRLSECKPDLELCKEAMKDYREPGSDAVTPEQIIDATCEYFGTSKADIIGKKKNKEVVEPRMVAIYIITDLLTLPLAAIGDLFGGREHTTVMHARDKVSVLMQSDTKLRTAINDIEARVQGK